MITRKQTLLFAPLLALGGLALLLAVPSAPAPRDVAVREAATTVTQVGGKPTVTLPQADAAPSRQAIAGEVVVQSSNPGALATLGSVRPAGGPNLYVVSVSQSADLTEAVAQATRVPGVIAAGPNYVAKALATPNDPQYPNQWNLTKIGMPGAWDKTTGSASTVIASLDTGVNPNHEDVSAKLKFNTADVPANGVDDDNNGYTDDSNGMDFVNAGFSGGKYINDANGSADDEGHGSLTASVFAASTNNATGLAGVNWQAKIMPVKVLDTDGFGSFTDIANGIRYAADNGAKVINMSLGAQGVTSDFNTDQAIAYAVGKGVTLVAASGNDGNPNMISYPAINSNVISVGATTSSDSVASYSNGGSQLTVTAPGSGIIGADAVVAVPGNVGTTAQSDVTSLLSPANYSYAVTAYNATGETVISAISSVQIASGQRARVTWSGVGGATGYRVYRSAPNGGSVKRLTDVGAATSYNDTGTAVLSGTNPPAVTGATRTNAYASASGTSLAAPHVAGLVGLLSGIMPQATPAQLKQIIQNSADKPAGMSGQARTNSFGTGRINVNQAISQTPAYSAQFVRQSPYPSLPTGQQTTIYVDYKNTGYQTWSTSGPNPVNLGTSGPRDRLSGLYADSWIAPNRVGSFSGKVDDNQNVTSATSVAPGETARFQFTITGPPVQGTFRERFEPVVEGVGWLGDGSQFWDITSGGSYSYAYAGQVNPPSTMTTGQSATVSLDLTNTGSATWRRNAFYPLHVGTYNPQDRASAFAQGWLSSNRLPNFPGRVSGGTVTNADAIAPGETARFTFTMKAPQTVGNYKEYFRPVVENFGYLPDIGIYFPTTVGTPPPNPSAFSYQYVGQSANPVMNQNSQATLQLNLKNTGSANWTSNGSNPVRLGTARPQDRLSGFSNNGTLAGWLSPTRIHLTRNLTDSAKNVSGETTIAPGETGQFEFNVLGSPPPGSYAEYFQPVVEGVTWLPDIGIFWNMTVSQPINVAISQQNTATFTATGDVTLYNEGGQALGTVPAGSPFGLTFTGSQYVANVPPAVITSATPIYAREPVGNVMTVQNQTDNPTYNRFRGNMYIKNGSPGTWLVNEVDLEYYLRGMGEVPDSWPLEAIKAQTTAARTYAARYMANSRNEVFNIYDTTTDQVYNGFVSEQQKPNHVPAVDQTKGVVVTYNGQLAQTYYSSDTGGATANNEDVWGGTPIPYLRAKADPYEKPDVWSKVVTQATLQANFSLPGNVDSINVIATYAGNRPKTLRFSGSWGSIDRTYLADTMRSKLGTRSSLINGLGRSGNDWVFNGRGFGHGIGMGQYGLYNQGLQGRNYQQMLGFYYTGVNFQLMY